MSRTMVTRLGLVVHPRRELTGALDAIRRWSEENGVHVVQVPAHGQDRSVAELAPRVHDQSQAGDHGARHYLSLACVVRRIANLATGASAPSRGNAPASGPAASPGGQECQAAQAKTHSPGT